MMGITAEDIDVDHNVISGSNKWRECFTGSAVNAHKFVE